MVGVDLEGREYGRYYQSGKVFAPVCQHHAAYHRRQVCQGHHLPQVAGGYDDEEIARERPYY